MKKLLITACMVLTNTIIGPTTAHAGAPASVGQVLVGDEKLACEAILCLASGTQPSECNPSLQRYFSIRHKKFSDTMKARNGFLNLCPTAQQNPQMSALVNSLTYGAGRCDSNSLNVALRQSWGDEFDQVMISNQMPGYCSSYFQHEYTNFQSTAVIPKYVGVPQRGGYWVESSDYEQAYAQWLRRVQAEDAERARQNLQGN